MADKKLVTSTVSSRERGMQRKINQGTTSSQIEQTKSLKESQIATNGIHMSSKRKDNKMIFFNEIMKESKIKGEQRAAASSESTVPQEDTKAEAAKEEGPSTETAVNKDVGGRSEASPHDCIEETHKKRTTFIVLQKNTRSLNSSERLEEMHSELHDIRWDAILISETWRQSKEIWETQQGHIMVESGKFTNKHGVAILLNRRWKNCINWIQCACERVVAMSISIYKHPVVLMSVFLPHSGFADHHVERTYKTIIDTIKKEKCAKIIGGDFNAELGPGEGVELSAVVHYTLNKVNGRGEWMTQWLLENKLVALNTMYQKIPQKQVTYRSPKKRREAVRLRLVGQKHQPWSRDAESTDILHMGSDHRCVMAKLEITAKEEKGKQRKQKAPMVDRQKEINEDDKQQEYLDIEQEVKETEWKKNKSEGTAGEATNTSADAATKRVTTEAEGRNATEASAAEMAAADNQSTSKREAEATKGTAATAGKTETTDASAAHAAAALDVNIETRQAVATEGPAAQEDQDTSEKETYEFGPSYKKGRILRSTKKNRYAKELRK